MILKLKKYVSSGYMIKYFVEKDQGLRACLQFGAQSSRLARMLD